jgi:hypothetical protein
MDEPIQTMAWAADPVDTGGTRVIQDVQGWQWKGNQSPKGQLLEWASTKLRILDLSGLFQACLGERISVRPCRQQT